MSRRGGHANAFAADTVLGQWLRAQPVVLKAGAVLLIHGRIAPQFAASVFEQGKANVVHTGVGRKLNEGQGIRISRTFSLGSADDWGILGSLIHRSYKLSRLPYPY